ncbi:hypothetical protein ACFTAO_14290 [Paenibacillus rhizoplanae]
MTSNHVKHNSRQGRPRRLTLLGMIAFFYYSVSYPAYRVLLQRRQATHITSILPRVATAIPAPVKLQPGKRWAK